VRPKGDKNMPVKDLCKKSGNVGLLIPNAIQLFLDFISGFLKLSFEKYDSAKYT